MILNPMLYVMISFDSKMVRLKGELTQLEIDCILSFDSKMVRLKVISAG